MTTTGNDHWPRRLYLARRSSFQLQTERWDALQECERERWRHIAARITVTDQTTGKALFEAWSFDLNPKPFHRQPLDYQICWQRMAGYCKAGLRKDVSEVAA
jgi:hypothetical protein